MRFTDDSKNLPRMTYYTTEQLGPKRSRTPEGFLLCEDVPLARTGEMHYGPGEVPVTPGPDGIIRIVRDAEVVFSETYIASLNGKPVVNEHPMYDVLPVNFRDTIVGVCMNVRRGTGDQADLLLGDLMIYDPEAIDEVCSGKREVSAGYQAEYEELGPGRGRQYDLIGNHIALVRAGRCGPRCAIGDRKTLNTHDSGGSMPTSTKDKKSTFLDRLMTILDPHVKDRAAARSALESVKDELPDDLEDQHIHIHTGSTRDEEAHAQIAELQASVQRLTRDSEEVKGMFETIAEKLHIGDSETEEEKAKREEDERKAAEARDAAARAKDEEEELKEEVPSTTTDAAIKATRDSSLLSDSYQETVALAEILVPGIKVPTFDSKAPRKATFDAICGLRRTALDQFGKTQDGAAIIEQVSAGKPLDLTKASCRDVRALFRAVGAVKKAANSASSSAKDTTTAGGGLGVPGKINTPAALNKRHAEFYGKRASA